MQQVASVLRGNFWLRLALLSLALAVIGRIALPREWTDPVVFGFLYYAVPPLAVSLLIGALVGWLSFNWSAFVWTSFSIFVLIIAFAVALPPLLDFPGVLFGYELKPPH